jgi:hypothetical protein
MRGDDYPLANVSSGSAPDRTPFAELIADVVTGKLDVRGVEPARIDAADMAEGLSEVDADEVEHASDADGGESSEVEA